MNNEGRCLEYYFDSKNITKEELIKNIEEAKLEFPNKKVNPNLCLNEWGVYILKIHFTDKMEYVSNLKEKRRNRKVYILTEKNRKTSKKRTSLLNRKYGQYKKTKEYRPI